MMRRLCRGFLAAALLISAMPGAQTVRAYDFSDEEEWIARCSAVQDSSADSQACEAFREYYTQQQEELEEQVSAFQADLDALQDDMSQLEETVQEQHALLEELEADIEEKNASIEAIQETITQLEEDIQAREEEIARWDAQIKARMLSEQASLGTNQVVDMIMDSGSLEEMMRTLEGLQRITESDSEQIESLEEEKAALQQQRSEQDRLQETEETQREQLQAQRRQQEKLLEANEELITLYRQQEAQLQEEMRSAQVDIERIGDHLIDMDTAGDYQGSSSDGWLNPIEGPTSAGTWYYPGGGVHLGVDRAVSVGTPIHAPADGLIVWAANPADTNGGYLGNWAGYPNGAGNNIAMLVRVNDTTYFVSFSHMAQYGMTVSAGDSVSQGDVIGLTGNSGNSSGAHCHIEIINLGSMSISEAASQFASTADFAWGCGWSSPSTGCDSKGSTPCRERPETLIG